MLKKILLVSAPVLLAGLAYTTFAQTTHKTVNSVQVAPITTDLTLSEDDKDLLLSILRPSFDRNERQQIEQLEQAWTRAFQLASRFIISFHHQRFVAWCFASLKSRPVKIMEPL